MRLFQLCIVWSLVGLVSMKASADPVVAQRSGIPSDAVAYWRLDTSRFAASNADPAAKAQRRFLLAGMRAAVASGIIKKPGAAHALEGLLAASEVGSRPHTVCLLDLTAGREPSGTGMAPSELRIVLEIETPTDHTALLRTVRAILIGDGKAGDQVGAQHELTLPGGVQGVTYREPDWAPWHDVSWASTDHSFVIGLGAGALERWFGAQQVDEPTEPAWRAHQSFVDRVRPKGDVFFEAYLALDRVRQGFPEAFIEGRVTRVLETLSLSNARDVMVHGRWVEASAGESHAPMIAADITWSDRSEKPGIVHGLPISESRWPTKSLRMAPPPGSYLIVMRVDWERWVRTAMNLFPASSRSSKAFLHRIEVRNWFSRTRTTLPRFLSKLEPWLVVSDYPTPMTPIPGAATYFAELTPGASVQEAGEEFRDLIGSHMKRVTVQDGVWWFSADPGGVLRIPAWGFVGTEDDAVMVGGWGPPVVTENRTRLGDPFEAATK